MNREELKKILPHREPMLLVDEAYLNEDGTATGYYNVRGDEYFLQGHFPGNPIVPGVIQCEIMAQSACVLFADKMANGGVIPVYTGLDKVRFRNMVKPGDRILLCSDGLYGMAEESVIARIMRSSENPEVVCKRLIREANANGGRDNISAAYIRIG